MVKGGKLLAVFVLVLGIGKTRAEVPLPREHDPKAPAPTPSEFGVLTQEMEAPSNQLQACPSGPACRCPCLKRLWDWLCYRPTPCTGCPSRCECSPCGTPRLYIFFLCDENNGGGNGCTSCGGNGHLYGR